VSIFSYIFTAHAQKRLFMSFRWIFWHGPSIPWARFLDKSDISAICGRFQLIF